jgi:hypothetical protein
MSEENTFDDLVKECTIEYTSYRKQCKSESLINRIKKIYTQIDDILKKNCSDQYAKVEELCTRNELNQFEAIKGKEDEAKLALLELRKCPHNFSYLQKKLKVINDLSEIILENLLEICLDDCYNIDENKESCIRNCYFKSHDYTTRSFEEYLDSQLSVMENKIYKF